MSQKTARQVRRIAIALLGLAVVFTLLGGIGTTCVAFNAEQFGKAFEKFIGYKVEYQMMVYISIVTALVGIVVDLGDGQGQEWSYIVGTARAARRPGDGSHANVLHSTIKQVSFFKTPPTNMRFYTTCSPCSSS